MSQFPQELALFNATERILAEFGGDPRSREAHTLVALLHKQCSAYHVALTRIAEIARQGGMTDRDIFNVLDNLDQPL